MRRDPDLLLAILERIEQESRGWMLDGAVFDDLAADDDVGYHLEQLEDAGFYEAGADLSIGEWKPGAPIRLTHEGHEFLEAARNPDVWEQAREAASEKSLDLTLEVLQSLLKSYAEKKLDLG